MSELEPLGVQGPEYLRETLRTCTDPLKAIDDFQLENGVHLPNLRTMLPLLDLHGVRRSEFHQSVMEEMREKLLLQINVITQKDPGEKEAKLKQLLDKIFPLIKSKFVQPIAMAILKHMESVDANILMKLVNDKELYALCETEVKRQIWQDNQVLFGDEVSPLLSQYIREKESLLFDYEKATNLFFNQAPKTRRQGQVIQKLTHMIGKNVRLYDMVLQFLRTLFLRTRNVHYCTLRAELLMALHDLEINEIVTVDPCHKFTWCLDACIREKTVDPKRSRELQGFLDGIRKGHEQVLGDLSMILCDPYAVNFLAFSALRVLVHVINSEGLPRDNNVFLLLLRMLTLGFHAWGMIDTQVFKEPKLDPQVVIKFAPALMTLIVDDSIRNLNSKLPASDRESAISVIEHSGPPPDAYQLFVQSNIIAGILAMYYTLNVAKSRDKRALMRVLGTLASCEGERAFEDSFLHNLVAHLLGMCEEFSGEDFCTVVFDEFFMAGFGRDTVVCHLLKLLWHAHARLPPARLESILKTLQPAAQHSEIVFNLYESLLERVKAQQAAVGQPSPKRTYSTSSTEGFDFPMPTPSHL